MKYLGWLIGLIFIGIFVLFYNFKYLPTEAELVKQTDENIMWQNQIQELKKTQQPYLNKYSYTLDELFISPTSLTLSPKGESTLKAIVPELQSLTGDIQIVGHTDNSPINPTLRSKYPTKWELSIAWAITVLKYLIKQGIKSDRLVTIGYGDTRPIADNTTEEGRRKNRRIEITVVRR